MLKILTVSDEVVNTIYDEHIVHRFGDVELVLSCGDLPFYYLEYIVSMLNVPLLYVLGNHAKAVEYTEGGREVRFPGGCENIDGRVVEVKGLVIAGLEGSIRYRPGPYQYTERAMSRKVTKMAPRLWWNSRVKKRPLDILITHAPPLGIQDGEDHAHRGFETFLRFLAKYKPRYHIHGHTHIYRRDLPRRTQWGGTEIVNTCGYQVLDI